MTKIEQILLINLIREKPARRKGFNKLTKDQQREFLELIDGDVKWLDELLKDFVEVKTAKAEAKE